MSHIILKRSAVVAALLGLILAAGCSQQPKQPSEVELQARAILNETFAGDAENWFAVEKTGGKLRLVELHGPQMSLHEQSISETERMNGVSVRAKLTVTCRQYRWFEGTWSEWRPGMGENALVGALFSVLAADWGMRLEKKNGQWTATEAGATHNFQRDRELLVRMMRQAPP
jgi:hypothetical protein